MIEFSGVGQLRSPIVVAAFEGWNDAADASSAAVEHLESAFDAKVIGAIDPDDYYDFQVNRPTVSGIDGASRKISWPTTRLSVARLDRGDNDLVLIRGLEPNMRWRGFTEELIEAVHALGSEMVISLGALLADSPHTRPVPISGTAGDPATAARLRLEPSKYEGATGIVGVFAEACARAELASVSFWAAVPHYVANPPCPKATLALLRRVEDLLDMEIPLGDLAERARAWERQVDELAAGDSEVAEYVRALESREPETELPEASGDAIAREFERYLRRRRQ
ncbi:PAC2 family protein [Frankia sp. CiP3]|uniref:PAC2 family protein n=1 Tax=Frankia sp. CiP3 TaxID=2880971 RepID=UPI001EF68A53|nr:PAC2 family protein [Frankia sp. CiP3]